MQLPNHPLLPKTPLCYKKMEGKIVVSSTQVCKMKQETFCPSRVPTAMPETLQSLDYKPQDLQEFRIAAIYV